MNPWMVAGAFLMSGAGYHAMFVQHNWKLAVVYGSYDIANAVLSVMK